MECTTGIRKAPIIELGVSSCFPEWTFSAHLTYINIVVWRPKVLLMLTDHLSNLLEKEEDPKETDNSDPWFLVRRITRQRYRKDDKVQNVRSCDGNVSCPFDTLLTVGFVELVWPYQDNKKGWQISYLAKVFHLLRWGQQDMFRNMNRL